MKRRDFIRSATGTMVSLVPSAVFSQVPVRSISDDSHKRATSGKNSTGEVWYQRPLRIYHPNAREFELASLDVKRFVADCRATECEAIVVSAGGVYAFYPSQVKYHHVSKVIGSRDLLGDITAEARRQDLKVIARVDFAKARQDVWQDHPAWFRRDTTGKVVKSQDYFATCPLGGYQNEDFAFPVIREISQRYHVDGFHLNAGGFGGYCYCPSCAAAFEGSLPTNPQSDPAEWRRFLAWREEALGRQLAGLYRGMRESNPEAFFMAELPGEESPEWWLRAGYHLPSLRDSFSQLLFTSGEMASARRSRWWVDLTAAHAYAVQRRPLVNIKMEMRDLRASQTFMPPAEFSYYSYQALAHGAGLKLVTLAIPEQVLDTRTMPRLTEVFAFMRQQREVFDTMQLVSPVALVWPEWALLQGSAMEGKAADALRSEFQGLYTALRMRHVGTGVVYDEQISEERLRDYEAVIVPTAAWLSDVQVAALSAYIRAGGRLILFDSPAADPKGFRVLPPALTELLGGNWTQTSKKSGYAMPVATVVPTALQGTGPLPLLSQRIREVREGRQAQVWYRGAQSDDTAAPEDIGELKSGADPIVVLATVGRGSIFYIATGLGQIIEQLGHVDYLTLIEAMISHRSQRTPPLVTNAPSTVDVTLGRWKRGKVIHMVNGTGPAPLDAVTSIGPIEIDVAWDGSIDGAGKVEIFVPGRPAQPLPSKATAGRIRCVVPRLDAYAQIVIRSS